MAQLALGIVGAVVGTFFGMPQVGFMIGSAIGGLLFAQKGSNTEGPKLSDLTTQTSQLGTFIGIVYGTVKRAGNVIWSSPKIQHKKTESAGSGKGGGGSTVSSYYATVSFMIALSEAEISGIKRIWINDELKFTASNEANAGEILSSSEISGSFRIYRGTEDQLPDPTYESYVGVGNAPAYRGIAYIVFTDFNLENYQNTIPQFHFEVVSADAGTETYGKMLYNFDNYYTNNLGTAVGTTGYNLAFGFRNSRFVLYPGFSVDSGLHITEVSGTGATLYASNIYQNDVPLVELAGHEKKFNVDFSSNTSSNISNREIIDNDVTGPTFYYSNVSPEQLLQPIGKLNNGYHLYVQVHNLQNAVNQSMNEDTAPLVLISNNITNPTLYIKNDITSKLMDGKFVCGAAVDYERNSGIIFYSDDEIVFNSNTSNIYYDRFSITDTSINIVESGVFAERQNRIGFSNRCGAGISKIDKDVIWTASTTATNDIRLYFIENGIVNYKNSFNDGKPTVAMTAYKGVLYKTDNDMRSSMFSANRFLQNEKVSLANIVKDQLIRADVRESEIEVLELNNDLVYGYLINNQSSARANIEKIATAYYFDMLESDKYLKAKKRGRSIVASIHAEDLAVYEGTGSEVPDDIEWQHVDELALPKRVQVSYWNIDTTYQVDTAIDTRETTRALDTTTYELPIVLDSKHGQQAATVLLYSAWAERDKLTFNTNRKYCYLEPTDVVEIENSNGTKFVIRITSKNEGANGILEFEAAQEYLTTYEQEEAMGKPGKDANSTVKYNERTTIKPMNLPLIIDQQSDSNNYYVAVAPKSDLGIWNGAVTFKSIDDRNYNSVNDAIFNSDQDSIFGTCINTLNNNANGYDLDITSSLTVYLDRDEELTSRTFKEILEKKYNYALIGNEVVQFMIAEKIADKTWTLRNFLRGSNGTEHYINSHNEGEDFILLDMNKIAVVQDSIANIDVDFKLTGITSGLNLSDGMKVTFANDGSSIKPLSPAAFRAIKLVNNDFDLNWFRRARINAGWNNNADVALDEQSEQYVIEFYNSSYSTLLNSYTVNNKTNFTYTTAMQAADYGSTQSVIYAKIYQISSRIGKGWSSQIAVMN